MSETRIQELIQSANDTYSEASECEQNDKRLEACRKYSQYLNLLDEIEASDDFAQYEDHWRKYMIEEDRSVTEDRIKYLQKERPLYDDLQHRLRDRRAHSGENAYEEKVNTDDNDTDDQNDDWDDEFPPPPPFPKPVLSKTSKAKRQGYHDSGYSDNEQDQRNRQKQSSPRQKLVYQREETTNDHGRQVGRRETQKEKHVPDERLEDSNHSLKEKSRGHKLDKKKKEVVEKVLQKGKVTVKGCRGLADDTLLNYFESPRRNWGEVVSVIRSPTDDDRVCVTFTSQQVIDSVLKEEHMIEGRQLNVSVYNPHDDEDTTVTKTIAVTGYGDLLDETLSMYFENSKIGGGTIEDLKRDDSRDVIYITYEESEVVERITNRRTHSFQNNQLLVVPHVEKSEKMEENPRTVAVQNYGDLHDDTLQMYFESMRIGGTVEEIKREEEQKTVYITFENTSDFEKVLQKAEHKLQNLTLRVSKPITPKQDSVVLRDTVVVKGHGDLKEETLQLYFEHPKHGGEVRDIWRTSTGDVCISFKKIEDAERVLSKESHNLEGHKLDVSIFTETKQETSEALFVSECGGLSDQLLNLYFENVRQSNGGEIKKLERDEDRNAIITFADPQVAVNVLSKKEHKINNVVVTVQPFVPKQIGNKTVEIRGFGSLSDDTLVLYFESPKSKGGEVKEVKRSGDDETVYITFSDEMDAKQVSQKTHHSLEGNKLSVKLMKTPARKPKTICGESVKENGNIFVLEVRGIPDSLTDESLELFFENRHRSGGGPIHQIERNRDDNSALIHFENGDVVKRVLRKAPLRHDGANLEVAAYVPQKKLPSISTNWLKEQKKGTVLEISGCSNIAEDTLNLYFENKKRSGGETLKLVSSGSDDIYYLLYESQEEAEKVASRSHEVSDRKIKSKIYVPPVMCTDRFLITGLNDETSEADITNFIEGKSGYNVIDVSLSGSGERAIVFVDTKEKPLDMASIEPVCKKWPLKGAFLDTSEVPVSKWIQVQKLPTSITESILRLYFESRRSGNADGVEVDNVDLTNDEKAYIHFQSHDVIPNILRKQHKLNDATLRVTSYSDCLEGEVLSSGTFHLPSPVTVEKLNKHKVLFIRQSPDQSMALEQQLSDVSCQLSWLSNTAAQLTCTVKKTDRNVAKILKTWKKDVVSNLKNYLENLSAVETHFLHNLLGDVKEKVLCLKDQLKGDIDFIFDEDASIVVVVGKTEIVEIAEKQVRQLIKNCEEEMNKKKTEVSERMKIDQLTLKLLIEIEFPNRMMTNIDGLKVRVDETEAAIIFTGQVSEVTTAKLQMYETTQPFTRSVLQPLPDSKLTMLQKKGVEKYIHNKLKNQNLAGAWLVDSQVDVIATTQEEVHKVAHIIKDSVFEHLQEFQPETLKVFSSKEWNNLLETLLKDKGDTLMIEVRDQEKQIHIIGTDDNQSYVVEEISNFINNKTRYKDNVKYPKGIQRFLTKYGEREIRQLASENSAHGTEIVFQEASSGFMIKGTKEGLQTVIRKLDELANRVKHATHLFNKPGIAKLLLSDRGDQHIQNIENTERCVIEREFDGEEMSNIKTELSKGVCSVSGVPSTVATFDLGNDRALVVMQGDITKMEVDAIVNAANNKLDHMGGLAEAIVKAGGQSIQDECNEIIKREGQIMNGEVAVSSPGDLSCRILIHAVGPLWAGGNDGEDDTLEEAVLRSMETTNEKNLCSIALPAISTGIFRFPVEQATRCIIRAIKDHFKENPESSVKEVYVCDNNEKTVDEFMNSADQLLGPSKLHIQDRRSVSRVDEHSLERSVGPNHRRRKETSLEPQCQTICSSRSKIQIEIIHGEITKQEAHVICNIASKNLDLTKGAVSKAILEEGGQILQYECSSNYPDGIDYGEFAVTQGGDLGCVNVFHICLPHWTQQNAEQILKTVFEKCLDEACKTGYNSIALPALGTGNLGFPRPIVAKAMFETIQGFGKKNPSASLQRVLIVLRESDIDTIKAFNAQKLKTSFAEGTSLKQNISGSAVGVSSKKASQVYDTNVDDGAKVFASENKEVYQLGRINFTIKNGDLTQEQCDCIVNSTNVELNLGGAVSQAILRVGGDDLKKELALKRNSMKKNGIEVTTARGLPAEYIIHVSGEFFRHDWKKVILRCLKEASLIPGVSSVAFPVFGTGQRIVTPKCMAVKFLEAFAEFEKNPPKDGFVSDIRVVIFEKEMYAPFTEKARQSASGNKKGIIGTLGGFFFGSGPEAVLKETSASTKPAIEPVAEVTLHFFSFDRENIEQAIRKIDSTYDESSRDIPVQNEALKNLSEEWVAKIKGLTSFGVKIDYSARIGRVRIRGIGQDALAAQEALQNLIFQIKENNIENQAAQVLADKVQWSCINQQNKKIPYDARTNKIIEEAFRKKKPRVTFLGDMNVYITVDFHQMVEYSAADSSDSVAVVRDEKTGGEVFERPSYWVPQTLENERIPVQPNSREYGEVTRHFYSTLKNGPPRTLLKIERCQNQFLWQQYAGKKKQMDKQNAGHQNEQQLFHGTASDAIGSIMTGGFNRRYAKNAKAYGDGVYFSVDASYASQKYVLRS